MFYKQKDLWGLANQIAAMLNMGSTPKSRIPAMVQQKKFVSIYSEKMATYMYDTGLYWRKRMQWWQ